jgi:integrase
MSIWQSTRAEMSVCYHLAPGRFLARFTSSPATEARRPSPSASLAISAGVNVLALQRMLGHTSAKVTLDTYADLFDDDLDAVVVTLDSR